MKALVWKRVSTLAVIALCNSPAFAQSADDAFRYSSLNIGGTARFMAMEGAFTAVGGDMSALTFNPGGIGVFIKSQLTFTPGFSMQNVNSTYNGNTSSAQSSIMNIQNFGWIGTWRSSHPDALWKNINFGIVYNRTNDFNATYIIGGNNSKSTLLDQFVNNSNGTDSANLDPFGAQQAFNTGLLQRSGSSGSAYTNIIDPFLNGTNTINQTDIIDNSGSMGETDISFGGNYNNKLDIGFSIGIPDINFSQSSTYSETPNYRDTLWGLQNYTYANTLNTSGIGVNFKVGAIYRVFDWLRVGAAVHTPTWFSMTDNYTSLITANYSAVKGLPGGTWLGSQGGPMTGSYNYGLTTPMRAMGGLAVIIHHQAIISADYEWVDYNQAQFSPANVFDPVNQAIRLNYAPQNNIRVGAELVLYPFSLRAGYAYYTSPYTAGSGNTSLTQSFSAGVGVKLNHCFIDLAYMLTQYSENYYMYNPSLVNPATNNVMFSNVAITFGVNL